MKDKHDKKTQDMFKAPAKSSAERQRAYRERLRAGAGQRLDLVLDNKASQQLEMLAKFFDKSKKDMLADVIATEFRYMRNTSEFRAMPDFEAYVSQYE